MRHNRLSIDTQRRLCMESHNHDSQGWRLGTLADAVTLALDGADAGVQNLAGIARGRGRYRSVTLPDLGLVRLAHCGHSILGHPEESHGKITRRVGVVLVSNRGDRKSTRLNSSHRT